MVSELPDRSIGLPKYGRHSDDRSVNNARDPLTAGREWFAARDGVDDSVVDYLHEVSPTMPARR